MSATQIATCESNQPRQISHHEARNRLLIGLEREEVREQIEDKLEQMGVPRDAVIIEVTGPTELLNDTLTSEPPVRPTVGGLQINDGIDAVCSLGFNVIREATGVAGFITNSHCTVEEAGGGDGRPIYQLDTPPENRLGIETIDPSYFDNLVVSRCPVLCRWGDAALECVRDSQPERRLPRRRPRACRHQFAPRARQFSQVQDSAVPDLGTANSL